MSRSILAPALLGLALAVAGGAAQAQPILFSQPLSGSQYGLDSNVPGATNPATSQQVADRFTLSSAASITAVRWFGFFDISVAGDVDSFELRFFADAGAGTSPVATPFQVFGVTATAVATGVTNSFGLDIFEYVAPLPSGLPLAAGSYWFSVVENEGDSTRPWTWANSDSGEATNNRRFDDSDAFVPLNISGREHRAFALLPEPQAALLLGVALAALSLRRRS